MPVTEYNSYRIADDPLHLFTPEDLESMAAWDAKIEAEFAAMNKAKRTDRAREDKRRRELAYYYAHRDARNAYGKEYRKKNAARIREKQRAKYLRKKAEKEAAARAAALTEQPAPPEPEPTWDIFGSGNLFTGTFDKT